MSTTLSWTLLLPALMLITSPLARAADDASVKSVYIIPRAIKANDQASTDAIKTGKVESVEVRFNLKEARARGGAYFTAIHHVPGKADVQMGSVNYDDYQYSTGLLKKDFDQLWGKMLAVRDGASILATGGTLYLLYAMATRMAEKKVWVLSVAASNGLKLAKSGVGKAILFPLAIETVKWMVGFYNEFLTNGELKVPFTTDAHCTQSFLQRLVGNDQCNKTIQTPWSGFKGKEMAERDWLYRVLDQSYENAKYATPIDDKQFDVDAAYDRYHQILTGQQVDVTPAPADGSAAQAKQVQAPLINTVPMKENMEFAVKAMNDFFKNYVEANAEDTIPNDAATAP